MGGCRVGWVGGGDVGKDARFGVVGASIVYSWSRRGLQAGAWMVFCHVCPHWSVIG
jgi:hypothetical protein